MKLILPDGRELPAKFPHTARLDAVIELQLQGGVRCSAENIKTNVKASSAFAAAVIYFLTLLSAGEKVRWVDVLALSQTDLGHPELEPGDPGYGDTTEPTTDGEEADGVAGPTEPAAGTDPPSPPA